MKTDVGKYEQFLTDIHKSCPRIKINLFDKINLKEFELMDKYMDDNGKFSDEGIVEIVKKAKHNSFFKNFLINHYNFHIPEKQMSELINSIPATEIHNLFQRNDLSKTQLDEIVLIYESHRGTSLSYLIDAKPELFSNTTIEYLFNHRTSDFERWNFAPYKILNDTKRIEEISKSIDTMPNNEKLNLAIVNNDRFPINVRNKAFANGCDYAKVEKVTPQIMEEIYASAVQTMFDYEYTFAYATKIDNAKKQISKHIEHLPLGCVYDFLHRCSYTDQYHHQLSSIVQNTNDGRVLKEILRLDDKTANMLIQSKPKMDEVLYEAITAPITHTSTKRKYAIKMLYTTPILDETLLNEFFEKPDRNMMMAMAVAPYHSINLHEKIKNNGDSEIKTLCRIKERLNENNQYFSPRVHSVLLDITLRVMVENSSKELQEVVGGILSKESPKGFYQKHEVDFIIKKLTETIEDKESNPRIKKAVRTSLHRFKEDVNKNQPFLFNDKHPTLAPFPIFGIEDNKVVLKRDNITSMSKKGYEDMISLINELPEQTLHKMKKIMAGEIAEGKGFDYNTILYRVHKLVDFYNKVDERLNEIKQEKIELAQKKENEENFEK